MYSDGQITTVIYPNNDSLKIMRTNGLTINDTSIQLGSQISNVKLLNSNYALLELKSGNQYFNLKTGKLTKQIPVYLYEGGVNGWHLLLVNNKLVRTTGNVNTEIVIKDYGSRNPAYIQVVFDKDAAVYADGNEYYFINKDTFFRAKGFLSTGYRDDMAMEQLNDSLYILSSLHSFDSANVLFQKDVLLRINSRSGYSESLREDFSKRIKVPSGQLPRESIKGKNQLYYVLNNNDIIATNGMRKTTKRLFGIDTTKKDRRLISNETGSYLIATEYSPLYSSSAVPYVYKLNGVDSPSYLGQIDSTTNSFPYSFFEYGKTSNYLFFGAGRNIEWMDSSGKKNTFPKLNSKNVWAIIANTTAKIIYWSFNPSTYSEGTLIMMDEQTKKVDTLFKGSPTYQPHLSTQYAHVIDDSLLLMQVQNFKDLSQNVLIIYNINTSKTVILGNNLDIRNSFRKRIVLRDSNNLYFKVYRNNADGSTDEFLANYNLMTEQFSFSNKGQLDLVGQVNGVLVVAYHDSIYGGKLGYLDTSGMVKPLYNRGVLNFPVSLPPTFDATNDVVVHLGKMYFPLHTTKYGTEIWVTEGLTGTNLFADVAKGSQSSNPMNLYIINNKLVGSAFDLANGRQLRAWPLNKMQASIYRFTKCNKQTSVFSTTLTNIDNSLVKATWYFDNGDSLKGHEITYNHKNSGSRTVVLVLRDLNGNVLDSITEKYYLYSDPEVSITGPTTVALYDTVWYQYKSGDYDYFYSIGGDVLNRTSDSIQVVWNDTATFWWELGLYSNSREGCWSDTVSVTVSRLTVKGSEIEQQSFAVYPNPNNGHFIIYTHALAKEHSTYKLEVFNALGKVVRNELITGNSSHHLQLNKPGTYTIRISANDYHFSKKVIVIK